METGKHRHDIDPVPWQRMKTKGGPPLHILFAPGSKEYQAILESGTEYEPGTHNFITHVRIFSGWGVFYLDGQEHTYFPGASYAIPAGAAHCFALVLSRTQFLRSW